MSVMDELKKLGGCVGGVTIYFAAKDSAWVANHVPGDVRTHRKLSENTQRRFQKLFPKLDLGRVRFSINCNLPGNWFAPPGDIDAMTFGYHIYCKGSEMQQHYGNYLLLIHELVHVDQVRHWADSESKFACEYGKGYLQAGNYRDNHLESEAYDFVDAIPFNPGFYVTRYDDLAKAYGTDEFRAFCHWLDWGIDEGRASSRAFDVSYYLDHYPDLQAAYGTDYAAAIRHWIQYGLKEGRRASAAFDAMYYLNSYSDLQGAFGKKNYVAALQHWFQYGIAEGRQSAPDFDVMYYLSKYPDLQKAFGSKNYAAAIDHWLKFGMAEGRHGVEHKSRFRRPDAFTIEPAKVVLPKRVHGG